MTIGNMHAYFRQVETGIAGVHLHCLRYYVSQYWQFRWADIGKIRNSRLNELWYFWIPAASQLVLYWRGKRMEEIKKSKNAATLL